MTEERPALIERLYECFNGRDEDCVASLCADEMQFFPVATAEAVDREAPYRGPEGLRTYMADMAKIWEELQISADELEARGDILLVRGRVYARSRDLGIRDMPVAWVWELRGDRFLRGEVFPDPADATRRFAALPA